MKGQRVALPRIKRRYARYRLRVDRSGIQGLGVYSREGIPARRVVIEYSGRRLGSWEAAKMPFPQDIYVADLKNGYVVDGRVGGSGAEYANHSCKPNLKIRRIGERLFLVSLRKIRAGEELTWNYRYPVNLRRVPCRCGARNCRGTFRLTLE